MLSVMASSHTDSLRYVIHHQKIQDNNKRYVILKEIAENSTDADTIIQYSKQAIELAEKLNLDPAKLIIVKGLGYLQLGKSAEALEHFMKAAELYEKTDNNIGLATVYSNIAWAYSGQQNHTSAIKYLRNAVHIFENEQDTFRIASSLNNLGYEYYKIAEYDSALILFSHAQKIYVNINYNPGYAYCVGNSGLVYAKQKKYSEAEGHLLHAIKLLSDYGDDRAVTEFMIEYARILKYKGHTKDAIRYASRSYHIASRNNIIEFKRDAAKCLSHLYGSINQFDSAFYFQSLFIGFSDSIRNLETIQKMADLRTEFEVAQKQGEVDLLEKEKITQLIIIGALILIILLAGGLIVLYYTSLKRVRKFTAILEERRKLLEQQSTELKNLNHIKDRFFSIISHDLRGPISSLGGISFMIKESIENDNRALLQEIADYIDQTVVSLSGLLENLLNWALSQQGQLPFHIEKIDTKTLIREVVKLFTTISISKHIRIKLTTKDNLYIKADNNSIMTIIRNLLSNAFKFTNMGGVIHISTKRNKNGVIEIMISDNGIGIPTDKLSWLFQLREAKSTRGTEKEKGIGLGLTLVHEFVKLNKGEIKVQSVVGKGTTFTLLLPEADPDI